MPKRRQSECTLVSSELFQLEIHWYNHERFKCRRVTPKLTNLESIWISIVLLYVWNSGFLPLILPSIRCVQNVLQTLDWLIIGLIRSQKIDLNYSKTVDIVSRRQEVYLSDSVWIHESLFLCVYERVWEGGALAEIRSYWVSIFIFSLSRRLPSPAWPSVCRLAALMSS